MSTSCSRPGGLWERAWRDTEALLGAFQEEVRAHGARFLVAVIPYMLQVTDDASRVALDERLRIAKQPLLGERLDWNWPEQHLETVFHRAGIPHVQLLAPLRGHQDETRTVVFRKDGHLNGSGHELMGRHIAARLARDAADECFDASVLPHPISLARLYPDELALDVRVASCLGLFGVGWKEWMPAAVGEGGWPLTAFGEFLAPNRSGGMTLRGKLRAENRFPVTLVVSFNHRTGAEFARREYPEPGDFVLSFRIEPVPEVEDQWLTLELVVGGRKSEEPVALLLEGLEFRPDP
jgi:hypothetical protein